MRFRYRETQVHAPEPGLGGANLMVFAGDTFLGVVESQWNRTNGVHWVAYRSDGTRINNSRNERPRPFETRTRAAEALLRASELCPVCGQPDNCGDCNHEPMGATT